MPGLLWVSGHMQWGTWGGLNLRSGADFAQGPPSACLCGAIFVFGMALREEVCRLRTSQLF